MGFEIEQYCLLSHAWEYDFVLDILDPTKCLSRYLGSKYRLTYVAA
jgi:hypothetical protein